MKINSKKNEMIQPLIKYQKHLIMYFEAIQVPLDDLQRHQKGKKVDLTMPGRFGVLIALYSTLSKKEEFKPSQGESYILLARFNKKGPILESINAYSTSNHKKSPHYTDQMQFYTEKKLKRVSLDKEEILKSAIRTYHPK